MVERPAHQPNTPERQRASARYHLRNGKELSKFKWEQKGNDEFGIHLIQFTPKCGVLFAFVGFIIEMKTDRYGGKE